MANIDFPNSPTNGDELQAQNKFVYRWSGGNRWKNVHRPLVIPDYIWPDLSNPDDPFGTGDPGGGDPGVGEIGGPDENGGGGDDWLLEVIDFPVSNSDLIEINFTVNQDATLSVPVAGAVAVARISDFRSGPDTRNGDFVGDLVCEAPLIAQGGNSLGGGTNAIAQAGPDLVAPLNANPGTSWFTWPSFGAPDFTEAALRSWIDVNDYLSDSSLADKTQVQVRIIASGSFVGRPFTTQGCSVTARHLTSSATQLSGNSSVDFSFLRNNFSGTGTLTGSWFNLEAATRYISLEGVIGGGFEVGDIRIEINDPGGAPPSRDNLPVGFSSNPELTASLVAFDGTGGNVLRSMKHYNPGRLTNSEYWQIQNGASDGYLDVSTGLSKTQRWSCLWLREDLTWYATVDTATPFTVEGRHLYTVGDISTHSEIVSGQYDFRDYASQTPSLGTTVRNIHMTPDGDFLFIIDGSYNIRKYELTTPWDLGTVDAGSYDLLNLSGWNPTCFDITQDGYVIVLMKAGFARQIIMETAWDLLSAVDSGFERQFLLDEPIDVCVSADTGSIFVLDIPADTSSAYRIYNYTRNI